VTGETTLRVLSYNVLSLRRGTERVAAVIRACEPDVVCVQEAPRFLRSAARCRDLARQAGLDLVTGGRPAAATLLLAKPGLAVTHRRDVKLPWHPPRHRRGLAVATFGGVTVASTHLSLDAAERVDQARRVVALLAAYGTPVVLAGDTNDDPDGPAWAVLAAAWQDAYAAAPDGDGLTSTAEQPRRRIDGIFVDRRLRVLRCGVPDVPGIIDASDHRPLLAELAVVGAVAAGPATVG
jgi:endonuclease/exonuclease/phosphatase family metal-dependent hydrolase